jgi:hypothetical protein
VLFDHFEGFRFVRRLCSLPSTRHALRQDGAGRGVRRRQGRPHNMHLHLSQR